VSLGSDPGNHLLGKEFLVFLLSVKDGQWDFRLCVLACMGKSENISCVLPEMK